ncbi:TUDOR domain-containing protein [Phanerochaete sordida]|uniref:TUDOR domain-containing protein n=1 Tax=Phanerochaete sordida TaxID=48140 RepID=A0A9P3LAJ7_9APHY|nr:TUDOR domain-containing protein [Phanerochaete sordida]
MDKADLETYQVQLDQVELALQTDPSNTELSSLKAELEELIELTKAAIAQQEAAASSSKVEASRKAAAAATASQGNAFVAGDDCLAKYSGDGQWYPARVASVGGSAENRQYSVVFKGYNTTELVNAAQIKALPAGHVAPGPAAGSKRKLTKAEEEERERKKKKNEKKLEVKAAKAKEQTEKQATWQKFAKKSERKGIHIAGVSGTSIFKTPENPLGKVGVTGSGKGMTEVKLPGKHKFDPSQDPDA